MPNLMNSIFLAVVTFSLCSCLQDNETKRDIVENETNEVSQINGTRLINSIAELPSCDMNLNGQLFYSITEDIFQVCSKGEYKKVDLKGPDGDPGTDGSIGFDGGSCNVEDNRDDTATLSCTDGREFLLHNADNGDDAPRGQDGASCTISKNIWKEYIITCGNFSSDPIKTGWNAYDGYEGQAGLQGSSVQWLGALDDAPVYPSLNQAFYWNTKNISCSWNGIAWNKISQAGEDDVACPTVSALPTFTDQRDSRVYPYIVIGGQTWMAKNLNYKSDDGSFCYGELESNCDLFGRLYLWETAMDGSEASSELPSGVKGICPDNWHLPSLAEVDILAKFIAEETGLDSKGGTYSWTELGYTLKASSNLWNINTGLDEFGFSALPAGYKSQWGEYNNINQTAIWWTTYKFTNSSNPMTYELNYDNLKFYLEGFPSDGAMSVRCIKD